ncbi:hypothetical protein B9Z55_000015 [Caenorhabditis nigoni]|nr:hypothetical protein B9Z55_000015 [Caenorhabditis nigoni]
MSALNISCGGKLVNLKKVRDYFSSSPVFKRVDVQFMYQPSEHPDRYFSGLIHSIMNGVQYTTEQRFPRESKLYQAELIGITQPELAKPVVLHYFQGRQAFIKCDRCKNQDLIEFVNRWKLGEAFQKLEYLTIEIVFNEISQN